MTTLALPAARVATPGTESPLVRLRAHRRCARVPRDISVSAAGIHFLVERCSKGWSVYLAAISDPDAVSAIRLTLVCTAAIAVPANLVFGVAAAWAIAKVRFSRQERADDADRLALLGVAR